MYAHFYYDLNNLLKCQYKDGA